MTGREAILEVLKSLKEGGTASKIGDLVIENYPNVYKGETPKATVSANLVTFVQKGDSRVRRFKKDKTYWYYHTDNEAFVKKDDPEQVEDPRFCTESHATYETRTYKERDLHPLLCTYQRGKKIFTKTIFHEKSDKSDEYQKWVHPDIIGARFIEFSNDACQQLFKATNNSNSVEIFSYEMKREIKSDYELKRYFFQAVSNSSWANYGYLVAFDIDDDLLEEVERLNNSFGIGVIRLSANPYESKILFPARRHELDFRTIEKLCGINKDFNNFFVQIEKIITADPKFISDVKRSLESQCDRPLDTDSEAEKYCKDKNIPLSD